MANWRWRSRSRRRSPSKKGDMKVPGAVVAVAFAVLSTAVLRPEAQAPIALSPALRPPPPAPMPEVLRSYKPVTAERLKTPDASDWLMVRRTWDGWGYSPLDSITPANVARL